VVRVHHLAPRCLRHEGGIDRQTGTHTHTHTHTHITPIKAVPLQAWSGPEGYRDLRFPDFMKTAQDSDKVVSRMHRPPLPPGSAPGRSQYIPG